jgi:hypothetical protein
LTETANYEFILLLVSHCAKSFSLIIEWLLSVSNMLRVLIIDIRYERISGRFKTSYLCVKSLRLIRNSILLICFRIVQAEHSARRVTNSFVIWLCCLKRKILAWHS